MRSDAETCGKLKLRPLMVIRSNSNVAVTALVQERSHVLKKKIKKF